MEKICIGAAGFAVIVAIVCLWLGKTDPAFVAIVLGIVAWFLSYRARINKPGENS